jgi:hypothetical protein
MRKSRTVNEAMHELTWVSDIRALCWQGPDEYLKLWDELDDFAVNDIEDIHHWKFEASGTFSTRSSYIAFFAGSIGFEPWKRLWKSWPPANAKPLYGWLCVTDVGLLIACRKEDSLIPTVARYVTKKRRQSNTCSLLVCLHGSSGSVFSSH